MEDQKLLEDIKKLPPEAQTLVAALTAELAANDKTDGLRILNVEPANTVRMHFISSFVVIGTMATLLLLSLFAVLDKYPDWISSWVLGAAIVVCAVIWLHPKWQIRASSSLFPRREGMGLIETENTLRATLVQGLTGLALLVGLYFTQRTIGTAERQRRESPDCACPGQPGHRQVQ